MRKFYLLLVAIAMTILQPAVSAAAVQYNAPKYRGLGLDWCRIFEGKCGAPAAHAYCRSKGHQKASNFVKWNHPGFKTMTIGQNSICDPQHHRCDSFKSITCVEKYKVFLNPRHNNYRLDWCKTFSDACGRPAAYAFCKAKGYKKLVSFQKERNITGETMTIGDNSICNSNYHRCDTFSSIKCGS